MRCEKKPLLELIGGVRRWHELKKFEDVVNTDEYILASSLPKIDKKTLRMMNGFNVYAEEPKEQIQKEQEKKMMNSPNLTAVKKMHFRFRIYQKNNKKTKGVFYFPMPLWLRKTHGI